MMILASYMTIMPVQWKKNAQQYYNVGTKTWNCQGLFKITLLVMENIFYSVSRWYHDCEVLPGIETLIGTLE